MTESFTFDELVEAQRQSYHSNIASGMPVGPAMNLFMRNMKAGVFTLAFRDATKDIPETLEEDRDVHTEHCCVMHGCKYGNRDCPVERRVKHQSYDCEDCGWDRGDLNY